MYIFKLLLRVVVTFILTNFQDIVILMNFFLYCSSENCPMKRRHVVLGQYFGYSTLLLFSLIGYFFSYFFPVKLFGLLGFVIIGFGLNGLYQIVQLRSKRVEQNENGNENNEETKCSLNENDFSSSMIDVHDEKHPKSDVCDDLKQIFQVGIVTIANGNDNIAIYVPIFVQSETWEIIVYLLGFLVLVAALCLICYYFIRFPPVFKYAQKYAPYISPWIFIALGIYILIQSECFPWLFKMIQTGKWSKD